MNNQRTSWYLYVSSRADPFFRRPTEQKGCCFTYEKLLECRNALTILEKERKKYKNNTKNRIKKAKQSTGFSSQVLSLK